NGRLGVRAGSRWPFTSLPEADGKIHYIPFPFFLAYATALLKKNHKDAFLIDAIAQGIDTTGLLNEIASYRPKLIIIETSTASFENDINIIKQIKTREPNTDIALCGPHASACAKEIMSQYPAIEYILAGEYEETLLEFVEALEQDKELNPIAGLMFRSNGKTRLNPDRPAIHCLDDLPWPERKDVPIYKYNDGFAGMPKPNVQMWSSRGCHYKCSFCLWPQTIYRPHHYRTRNPFDVVDEMEYLVREFNFLAVYFDDDVFNADKNHVQSICRQIIKRKINVPWAAMGRADLMDNEMLLIMADAGLYAFKYGIESADERILQNCGKNLDLARAREIIKQTKSLGIKVHLTFCLGLPGETRQTADKTRQFIEQTQPDSYQLSLATAFPGTEYFKYAQEHGLLTSDQWADYDAGSKSTVKTQALSCREIERIKIDIDNYFNAQ
ncbi:MAG: radical SAM protein, partial [bacterium]